MRCAYRGRSVKLDFGVKNLRPLIYFFLNTFRGGGGGYGRCGKGYGGDGNIAGFGGDGYGGYGYGGNGGFGAGGGLGAAGQGIGGSTGNLGTNGNSYNGSGYGGYGGFGGGNNSGGGAGMGGALFIRQGALTLTNVTFKGNTATGGTGNNAGQGLGGAIFRIDATAQNAQASQGNIQGMPTTLPTVTATGVVFISNSASNGSNDAYGQTITSATNTAPSFTTNATLPSIAEDQFTPAGETLSKLFQGRVTDINGNSTYKALAVTSNIANSSTEGKWQYSTRHLQ